MKFAYVGVRNGKRSVNIAMMLLVGVLSAAIGTGLSFLIAAVTPASTAITTLTNLLPRLLPIVVVIPPLIRGSAASMDDLDNLDN